MLVLRETLAPRRRDAECEFRYLLPLERTSAHCIRCQTGITHIQKIMYISYIRIGYYRKLLYDNVGEL